MTRLIGVTQMAVKRFSRSEIERQKPGQTLYTFFKQDIAVHSRTEGSQHTWKPNVQSTGFANQSVGCRTLKVLLPCDSLGAQVLSRCSELGERSG